ncbi:MAG: DUF58 domain-containing protein [Parachlamydiaceae bacterium]
MADKLSSHDLKAIRRLHIYLEHLATDLLAGIYRSSFKGKGMEFEEVREYVPGDDIRAIDWNVTARMNHPFVKNFREEREATIILMVDISASLQFSQSSRFKSQILAEIAGAIAFSAIKNQDNISLILFSDHIEKHLPPSKGTRHVLRIIRDLIAFKAQSRRTNIAKALSFLGKVQKKRAVVFLLSDFLDDHFFHEAAIVSKKHDLIGIKVSDPLESQFPDIGLARFEDLETEECVFIDTSEESFSKNIQLNAEKRSHLLATRLAKLKIPLAEVKTNQNYLSILKQLFQKHRSRQ